MQIIFLQDLLTQHRLGVRPRFALPNQSSLSLLQIVMNKRFDCL